MAPASDNSKVAPATWNSDVDFRVPIGPAKDKENSSQGECHVESGSSFKSVTAEVRRLSSGLARDANTARVTAVSLLIATMFAGAGLSAASTQSFVSESFLFIALAISALTSVYLLFAFQSLRTQQSTPSPLGELEDRIELLADMKWEAQDEINRLKIILDGQNDMILHRDEAGHIAFANRAFCQMFAMRPESVIGQKFSPRVLRNEVAVDLDEIDPHLMDQSSIAMPEWAQRCTQRVQTRTGPCWIEWTHRRLTADGSGTAGIQTIGRDVTDQRRHERELAVARDDARAADLAKSRFLASMSHEIRTPMNGILGMAGLLAETQQTAEQRTYTDAVRKSATTLVALIDEILDFSRIEAERIELAEQPVDLAECVQSVIELLAPRAHQKGLEFAWSTAPDLPSSYLGDEPRLRQILLNLIGNAVKYTEVGGVCVWVGASSIDEESDRVTIVIRDSGPGLEFEAQARIFSEFERPNSARALQESGTGLGLAIARRLARNMDGDITVVSEPGSGATFTLDVQLSRQSREIHSCENAPLDQHPIDVQREVMIVTARQIERRVMANFLRTHDVVVREFADVSELSTEELQARGDGAPHSKLMLFDDAISPEAASEAFKTYARQSSPGVRVDAAVTIDPRNRDRIATFRAVGIANYLVRPVRPATLLALLSGGVDKPQISTEPAKTSQSPDECAEETDDAVKQWRVLIAEDNEINALLARTVLTRIGCVPILTANGREAVDEVARSIKGQTPPIDVVLMDLHMPEVDGLAATSQIREMSAEVGQYGPVIIAVTANAFQEDRDRCLAAGMDDYLSKPFEPADLKRVLDRVAQASRK